MALNRQIVTEYNSLLTKITRNDRALFEDIAKFSQLHLYQGDLLVDLMIKRLTSTPSNNRINYYYAIDVVIKHNKGDYSKHYGKKLCAVFARDLKEFSEISKKLKKDFLILFLTWESCISLNYLNKMLKDYLYLTNDVFPVPFSTLSHTFCRI